jgi:hypothetical protein
MGRFFCFFRKLVDLQQARFAVRMAAGMGLGAEPVAHYTRGCSKLARTLLINPRGREAESAATAWRKRTMRTGPALQDPASYLADKQFTLEF